ncbi:MAG: hypothetical protein QMB62_06230 [Oscillospiraceae bacterium]
MAKTSKSLRIDEKITNLIEDYYNFMNTTFENNLTFSKLVSNALVEYMLNETEQWEHIMESKSVVKPLKNGKLQRYEFTDEQLGKIRELHESATDLYAVYQNE